MHFFAEYQGRLEAIFEKRILLIVGATRWGTAWVQQCLDAHPNACAKGEGHFTDVLFPKIAKAVDEYNAESEKIGNRLQLAGLAGNAAGCTVDDVDHLLRTAVALMLNRWIGDTEFTCIVEKTPEHVLGLEILNRILPEAAIVHVVRDGRDEAVSAWEFNLVISRGEFPRQYPTFSGFAKEFGAAWSRSVGAAKTFGRRHRHRYLEIRGEDLVDNPDVPVASLFDFAGFGHDEDVRRYCMDLAWDDSPLDIEPGIWQTSFDDDAHTAFLRDGGELLKLLGYHQ